MGHRVTCADIDVERVNSLRKGEVPILEDGLPELLAEGLTSRRLNFVVGAGNAAGIAEFVFLCVPTPQGDDGCRRPVVRRRRDPRDRAGAATGTQSSSTSRRCRSAPPGWCSGSSPRRAPTEEIGVASNPEFLREGIVGARLPPPEPRGHRVRRPGGRGAGQRAVPLAQRADPRHRPGVGRDDQVRVQRVPGHQDLVRQRDREPLRVGRRRRPRGRARAWATTSGSGSSSCTPVRATAARASRRTPRRCSTRLAVAGYDFSLLEGVVEVNQRQHERMVEKVRGLAGGSLDGRDRRACGVSRSRRTPTTCATRRRW